MKYQKRKMKLRPEETLKLQKKEGKQGEQKYKPVKTEARLRNEEHEEKRNEEVRETAKGD